MGIFLQVVLCLLGATPLLGVDWTWDDVSPLDEYVHREDGAWQWDVIQSYWEYEGVCDVHVLHMVSQYWLNESWSSQPMWEHYMIVAVPLQLDPRFDDAAAMYISGGSQSNSPPHPGNDYFNATCFFAETTGMTASLLRQIPNQPIRYPNDPDGRNRTEDANIAWTWRWFLDNFGDNNVGYIPEELILQFPMTKAAVRALDTIAAMADEYYDLEITKFMPSGGSKRGWITWLLGCVDQRVVAMAPAVLSCLNSIDNFHHHYESMGGWSWVLRDYFETEIFAFLYEPRSQLLMDLIDPYSYRSRLTMPKLLMSATGDEFFLPDDSHFFMADMPDPMYLMMIENTNHGLVGKYYRAFFSAGALFIATLMEREMPEFEWEYVDDTVILRTERNPILVRGWCADTIHDTRLDYRWTTAEGPQVIVWQNDTEVIEESHNEFHLPCDPADDPEKYRACFIQVKFDLPGFPLFHYDFTTEVYFNPPEYPFEKCADAWECQHNATMV